MGESGPKTSLAPKDLCRGGIEGTHASHESSIFCGCADGHFFRATIVIIRYAHVFTLPRLMLASATLVEADRSDSAKFSELLQSVPSESVRKDLEKFNRVIAIAIMKNMFYRSFALYLLLRPIALIFGSSDDDLDSWTVAKPLIPPVEQLEDDAIEEARCDAKPGELLPV